MSITRILLFWAVSFSLNSSIAATILMKKPAFALDEVLLAGSSIDRQLLEQAVSVELAQVPLEPALPIEPPPPSLEPLPEPQPLPPLPSPDELLQPVEPAPEPSDESPSELPQVVQVARFNVICSTAFEAQVECHFDEDLLAAIAKQAITGELPAQVADETGECPTVEGGDVTVDRSLSFAQVLQARSAITEYYTCRGYVTSGAFIPRQVLQDGVVTIQVVEGSLEAINITGNRRLNSSYVRSRLAIATQPPVNINELLEALQLLQLDPLIANISADLQAGALPGTSLLQVSVVEADSFDVPLSADNGRSPSVGSFRQRVGISEANLLGLGDGISVSYTRTEGSDQFDGRYTLPINPRNGTISLAHGRTESDVVEEPFNVLDIQSESRYYELTYRQPISQTPTEEFALGLTATRQESESFLGIIEEPLVQLGADDEGRTRVSALRFFQEWTRRGDRQVISARSQFSLGLDILNATVNDDGIPDSRFIAWRGQGQWVRLLAPDTLALVRADVQLTPDSLLSLEQFGLGGQETIRGYRQDALLTDNGVLLSAEVRLPIARVPEVRGLLQIAPFLDVGTGWNASRPDPDPNLLVGTGLGLLWRMGDNFTARLDYGIPLVDVDSDSENSTLQEDGFYFSLSFTPF
jgi:hemolysin activation/secretion protein